MLEEAADDDLDGAVMGMAHRGRLNVLANIVGKSYDQIFKEFEGNVDPESIQGSGDVKYHLGQTGKFVSRTGKTIPVELAANPSHLEAVDPVVDGHGPGQAGPASTTPSAFSVLPLLIHGDAAFAGQGVVAETLQLLDHQGLPGRRHDPPDHQQPARASPRRPTSARSSEYCDRRGQDGRRRRSST